MKIKGSIICLLVIFHCSYAPPVSQDKSKEQDSEIKDDLVRVVILFLIIAHTWLFFNYEKKIALSVVDHIQEVKIYDWNQISKITLNITVSALFFL